MQKQIVKYVEEQELCLQENNIVVPLIVVQDVLRKRRKIKMCLYNDDGSFNPEGVCDGCDWCYWEEDYDYDDWEDDDPDGYEYDF